jgi:hypothetical protein
MEVFEDFLFIFNKEKPVKMGRLPIYFNKEKSVKMGLSDAENRNKFWIRYWNGNENV